MSDRAALLIDLENFYIGRDNEVRATTQSEVNYNLDEDLDVLCAAAEQIAGGRRLVVRRAYADFNAFRPETNGDWTRRRDYFLRYAPNLLMEHGIQPVQVFRFRAGGHKNAADMYLTLDAAALIMAPAAIDFFIIVTGDADFIPLVLDLRRRGSYVAGIGIAHSTSAVLPRYCDRFDYFSALAARDSTTDIAELSSIKSALHDILKSRRPLVFARVKPLLDERLGEPFDPKQFGCDSTGHFLRENSRVLGIAVRQAEYDWEVDLPTPGDSARPKTTSHSLALYRQLLRLESPKIHMCGYDDWVRLTDHLFEYVANADDRKCVHRELLDAITEEFSEKGMEDVGRKGVQTLFLLFKAGCFVLADGSDRDGTDDFHWSLPATLAEGMNSGEDLREQGCRFAIRHLADRLANRGDGHPDPGVLAELFYGVEPTPAQRTALQRMLSSL